MRLVAVQPLHPDVPVPLQLASLPPAGWRWSGGGLITLIAAAAFGATDLAAKQLWATSSTSASACCRPPGSCSPAASWGAAAG